jgi:hypothetical protein
MRLMATTPHPPAKPEPKAKPPEPKPEPKAAKPEPDPPVRTAADEQRERSEELQAKGVETVKAEQDERDPADKARQVPGVAKVEAAHKQSSR